RDILQAVQVVDVMDAIEDSMHVYERHEFTMPQRLHVDHEGNTLLLMPCFIKDYFATKLVTLFPENPERGVPMLNGLVVLNNGRTGEPIAVLDGLTLTALRTAAVGSVSIRHLAPNDARAVGIVGAGVQGFYQAWLACEAGAITDVYVYDLYPEKTSALVERLPQVIPTVTLHRAASVEELLKRTQIVITATTSLDPVLPDNEELLAGKHFVGIGSYKPAVREFPRALYRLIKVVYIDTDHAVEESGDLIVPLRSGWIKPEQVVTLGRFLSESKNRDEAKRETSLFKSVGMALFDVCASRLVYENAVRKGLGQQIEL
ncbi:MAG: ornithine cyclodeaminase family protein, partial [Phycisphaerales bacterium]